MQTGKGRAAKAAKAGQGHAGLPSRRPQPWRGEAIQSTARASRARLATQPAHVHHWRDPRTPSLAPSPPAARVPWRPRARPVSRPQGYRRQATLRVGPPAPALSSRDRQAPAGRRRRDEQALPAMPQSLRQPGRAWRAASRRSTPRRREWPHRPQRSRRPGHRQTERPAGRPPHARLEQRWVRVGRPARAQGPLRGRAKRLSLMRLRSQARVRPPPAWRARPHSRRGRREACRAGPGEPTGRPTAAGCEPRPGRLRAARARRHARARVRPTRAGVSARAPARRRAATAPRSPTARRMPRRRRSS
jgi:hypothetical protein